MQTQHLHVPRPLVTARNAIERLLRYRRIRLQQIRRNEIMFQQPLPRCDTKGVLINCGSVTIRLHCANGVYASNETSQPLQRGSITDFRCPSTLPREQGKTVALILVQTIACRIHYRRHNGYLLLNQLTHKLMLFKNRRVSPALWPVKLSDHRRRIFQCKLIHAVFITVQRQ